MKKISLSGLFLVALALAPSAMFAAKPDATVKTVKKGKTGKKKAKKVVKVKKLVTVKPAASAKSATKDLTDESIQKSLQDLGSKSYADKINELVKLASKADAGDFTGKTHRAVGSGVAQVLKEHNDLTTAMRNLLVQASTSPLLAQAQQQYVISTLIPNLPQAMQNVPTLGQPSVGKKQVSTKAQVVKNIKKARDGKVKISKVKKAGKKGAGNVGGKKTGKKIHKKGKGKKATKGATTATSGTTVAADKAVTEDSAVDAESADQN